ncbi:unnamed protein product [Closterium sp. NIES-53]
MGDGNMGTVVVLPAYPCHIACTPFSPCAYLLHPTLLSTTVGVELPLSLLSPPLPSPPPPPPPTSPNIPPPPPPHPTLLSTTVGPPSPPPFSSLFQSTVVRVGDVSYRS